MQIKPTITDFSKILSGEETKYRIPKYQRDYSWKYNEEVDELWRDIIFSFEEDAEYFIGNIVLNANGDIESANIFDIVDGQQRITTFSILFKVIKDYADYFIRNNGGDDIFEKWDYNTDYENVERIKKRTNDRLVYYGEPDNFYLELNQKDNPVYIKDILKNIDILKTEEDLKISSNEHRIVKTKKFFASKIIETFIKVENGVEKLNKFVNHLIKKLKINSIKVGEDYDAFLLFESLNSKGMNLSQTDLIKNKMLMLCDENDQKNTFENWNETIGNVLKSQNKNPVDFFYYHWLTFENTPLTKKTLYKNVQNKLKSLKSKEIVDFSELLIKTSNSYCFITNENLKYPSSKYESNSLEQYLSEIQLLKYSICLPSILYSYHKNNIELTKELARLSISYLFRTITIGELQVRKAKDTFDKILKLLKSSDNLKINDIKEIFIENTEINDDEFISKFKQKTFSNNLGKYSLVKIMQYNLGTETIVYEVDLEHVLPQSYEKHWNDFDFDKRKPEDVINNIGNMTLLNPGNNKKLQNFEFIKKIGCYKKRINNEDSESTTIPITYEIYDNFILASKIKTYTKNEYWDLKKIDERAEKLSKEICEIWKI